MKNNRPYIVDYKEICTKTIQNLISSNGTIKEAIKLTGFPGSKDALYYNISEKQKNQITELALLNSYNRRRTDKKYLSKLCRYGHEYKNNGQSLRYKSNGLCVVCHNQREGKQKQIINNLPNKEYVLKQFPLYKNKFLGDLCPKGHKYNGFNYSARWKINRQCVICHYNNLRLSDPIVKIGKSISKGIYKSIKRNKNGYHWEKLVNYTLNDLKRHLESKFTIWMNWDNYGSYWQIDHIKPVSSFSYKTFNDSDFKKCWSLSNLQPLEKEINFLKHNKISKIYENM